MWLMVHPLHLLGVVVLLLCGYWQSVGGWGSAVVWLMVRPPGIGRVSVVVVMLVVFLLSLGVG